MIDIHTHIIPNLDDGPNDLHVALQMLKMAKEQGITTLIATPHHNNGHFYNPAKEIQNNVEQLRLIAAEHQLAVQILPGQEFHLNDHYAEEFQLGRVQPLAESTYVLVELPHNAVPDFFFEFLYFMEKYNLRVIIAHPERNSGVIREPDQLYEWIDRGVLLQINSKSLYGGFGRLVKKTAEYLLRRNFVHFIASDAHDLQKRAFDLPQGLKIVRKMRGQAYVDWLLENTQAIIRNEPIVPHHPILYKGSKKLWFV